VRRSRAVFSLAALALVACAKSPPAPRGETSSTPAPRPVPAAPAPSPIVPSGLAAPDAHGEEEPLVGEAPESNPTSETVTIKLVADPARKARVFWGRKDLGLAPLELSRPRGSGPLDLIVVAPGALTLHTRVFTDRDDKLALRLYSEAEAPAMLGYREAEDPSMKPSLNPSGNPSGKPSGTAAAGAPKRPAPPR
jgi:hypothetical protein